MDTDSNSYVICVDNLYTGSKSNIQEFINDYSDRFEFIRHDITFPLYLEHVDQIYNLACPASPIHYQHDPVQTTKTNVHGSINVLGLAKRIGARVLQASTSEVYGDPISVHPQQESYWGNVNPNGIRSCYDEGKRCAETLFFDYHRQHNVDIRIARIFNTYGPYMNKNDGRVISNFITQVIDGKDITIYGDGSQTRSFCYVSDLVDGLISLMNHDSYVNPVNLGNPTEKTIKEIAEIIIELFQKEFKILYSPKMIFKPLPQDDPTRRCPDVSIANNVLDWTTKVPLQSGLLKTIRYFTYQNLKER